MLLREDRDLLARFRRGEAEALTMVFRHYVDDVFTTLRAGVVVGAARQRVGNRLPEADIEGLVQETFARAFAEKARQSYDGLRPYGAWLATIARNLLIDRARGETRDRRLRRRLAGESYGEAGTEDPTWLIDEERMKSVLQELETSLSEEERRIFDARYRQEMSLREAAHALGTGLIRVRRLDNDIRSRLLERLRAAGFLSDARVTIPISLLARRKGRDKTKKEEGER